MQRYFFVGMVAVWAVPARADDAPGVKQTIAYVQKLQTSNGGFLPMTPQPNVRLAPNLRSTSAGIRALHYWGGALPDKAAAIKFVESCWDKTAGGFANFPKGEPDVFTTSVGLMAVAELKLSMDEYLQPAARYLSANVKTFEDIRIAAAGFESAGVGSPVAARWRKEVLKLQNADGTFGKGAGQARDTGGSVACLLRLGGNWKPDRDAMLKILKDGQRRNGGYGKYDDEVASDLETTYRVMRCFVMLKARPGNVEGVRSFVAKCRNDDGGYGTAPGEPSNINGTYFAGIIRHWLDKQE